MSRKIYNRLSFMAVSSLDESTLFPVCLVTAQDAASATILSRRHCHARIL